MGEPSGGCNTSIAQGKASFIESARDEEYGIPVHFLPQKQMGRMDESETQIFPGAFSDGVDRPRADGLAVILEVLRLCSRFTRNLRSRH